MAQKDRGWTSDQLAPQTGKRFLITGATSGLGYETAIALAGVGGDVLLTGRNAQKGEAVHPSASIAFALCDVSSLASVRAFAQGQIADGRPIDALVNNAGVMALPKREETVDGLEMLWGTNVAGHFLLTSLLLPLLRAAPAPRTVQLSSHAHRTGKINLDDLGLRDGYTQWRAYAQSKLAMLIFAIELQRRSDAGGWGLTSMAAHPGLAITNILLAGREPTAFERFTQKLSAGMVQTAAAGAWPQLRAAAGDSVEPAAYYGPGGLMEFSGRAKKARIAKRAKDPVMATRLWDALVAMTGATWPAA